MSYLRDTLRKKMINIINGYGNDAAHDIYHLDRVFNMAKHINSIEKHEANINVLCLASYFHDLHRLDLGDDIKLKDSNETIIFLKNIFKEMQLSLKYFDLTKVCVEATDVHSFSKISLVQAELPIEARIIQDSDNLDALGAIGIARTFTFGQYIGEDIYNPDISLESKEYNLKEKSHSIIHHFYEKILKLEKDMNTDIAKKIAHKRSNYIREYLKSFFEEWG